MDVNTKKILYTKYSNDRAREFRISTQIIEYNDRKFVRKSAMEKSARPHVIAMKRNEQSLNGIFNGTRFTTNKIIGVGEDLLILNMWKVPAMIKFLIPI